MEQKKHHIQNDPGTWQTGRTEPPKRYSSLISVLLVLVILLCGISTALSILNFKLYRELTQQELPAQVSFSRSAEVPEQYHAEDLQIPQLGIHGILIPVVYQRYYKLPEGFYVTRVASNGEAFAKGVVAGDIITAIADIPVGESTDLEQLTGHFTPGQEVMLRLYRNGTESTLTLVWNE